MKEDEVVQAIIQHCYNTEPFNCSIISTSTESFFTVQTINKFPKHISKGDPVIVADTVKKAIIGGNIVGAFPEKKNIVIQTDTVNPVDDNRRKFVRYPVSLYGHTRGKDKSKQYDVLLKDISCAGLRIITELDMEIGMVTDFDIFYKNNVKRITATVLRKNARFERLEYGLSIIHDNRNSVDSMNVFIDRIVEQQFDMLNRQPGLDW